MSYVEKLAEASCPECLKAKPQLDSEGQLTRSQIEEYVERDCTACQGTSAMMPELRKRCPGPLGVGQGNPWTHKGHMRCEGRGWTLSPEREQRAVIEDWALEQGYVWFLYADHLVLAHFSRPSIRIEGRPDNKALAHAICQAEGIE